MGASRSRRIGRGAPAGVADELASAEQELLVNAPYEDALREKDRIQFLARGLSTTYS
ncbi:hypothetical protein ACIP6Q_27975 [Streptomyces bobili]|uniref:hypothetical protein n=1 Tax=Streptomyces bobili TaxID=67280 RepID=UPI00381E97AF